jgi:hypothetical protein
MNDPQNAGALIITLVMLPFIIILLILILNLARTARKAGASKRWPVSSGRVLSSHVKSRRTRNSNGTHSTVHEPSIVYEYDAAGQHFESSQISFNLVASTSFSSWAERVVAKYPIGSPVQVYYDPVKPSEAILEHDPGILNMILIGVLVFVELGLIGFVVAGLMSRL